MSRGVAKSLAGAAAIAALIVVAGAWGATGALTSRGCIDDEPPQGPDNCAESARGLDGAAAVALSADGRSLYVASLFDDAIVRFKRNTRTGTLTPKGCVDDNDTGSDDCAQSTNGLEGAISVALSPDGRFLYAASANDGAIARFKRNTTTGALIPKGCVEDNDTGPDDCGQSTNGLEGAISVVVSADGRSLYAASQLDDAVVRFQRNRTTGALTPKGCVDDNDTGADDCNQSTNGLEGGGFGALSRDGRFLYATSQYDNAIVRFKRNTTTGAITPRGCVDDNDTGPDGCGQSTNGLDGAVSPALSRDGRSLYVASVNDDAVVRLKRNTSTGALTPKGCVDDNDTGADNCNQQTNGLQTALSVAVSADGKSLYVAGGNDDAIVRFQRNRTTGALTSNGCVDDNDTGPEDCAKKTDGLDGIFNVALSADGRSLYAAGNNDDAIVRFRRAR